MQRESALDTKDKQDTSSLAFTKTSFHCFYVSVRGPYANIFGYIWLGSTERTLQQLLGFESNKFAFRVLTNCYSVFKANQLSIAV